MMRCFTSALICSSARSSWVIASTDGLDGLDAENDRRQDEVFSRTDDDVFDLPGREAGGGYFDEVFSGRDGEEGECAGAIGLSGAS